MYGMKLQEMSLNLQRLLMTIPSMAWSLKGLFIPGYQRDKPRRGKNIYALSLWLATFIRVPSQASETDPWAGRGEWEPLKRSSHQLNLAPKNLGPEGLPPTPAERKGWWLQPVTLPHLMPKVFLDPEITLTLQREGRPITGPESQPENTVCALARHSLIWKLQKCKVF